MNITPLTNQELFDRSATHLLTQMEQCQTVDPDDRVFCRYRNDAGQACAIGGVIPDELYNPLIENSAASSLVNGEFEIPEARTKISEEIRDGLATLFRDVDPALLDRLQAIHDVDPPRTWRERLDYLASRHYLDDSVLEPFT